VGLCSLTQILIAACAFSTGGVPNLSRRSAESAPQLGVGQVLPPGPADVAPYLRSTWVANSLLWDVLSSKVFLPAYDWGRRLWRGGKKKKHFSERKYLNSTVNTPVRETPTHLNTGAGCDEKRLGPVCGDTQNSRKWLFFFLDAAFLFWDKEGLNEDYCFFPLVPCWLQCMISGGARDQRAIWTKFMT